MKKILGVAILALTLNGCSTLSLSKYDNIEYFIVSEMRTLSTIAKTSCDDFNLTKENVNTLYFKSALFKNYAEKFEYNQDTTKAATGVHDIIKGMKDRYNTETEISETYCNLKMTAIESTTSAIQHGLARKPR